MVLLIETALIQHTFTMTLTKSNFSDGVFPEALKRKYITNFQEKLIFEYIQLSTNL